MAMFPGLIRTKELQKRSFDGSPAIPEPSSPLGNRRARTQALDSPYFKSQSNSERTPPSFALKEKAIESRFDSTTQASTPRLDSQDTSISPPRLKRSNDRVASQPGSADHLRSFELPNLTVCSSTSQTTHSSFKDARPTTDTDMLYANNSRPRRGPSDDNSSSFSGETHLSGSTSSRTKENTCRECKFKGHANLPLIQCSTCKNRFHKNAICINPRLCDVKSEEEFRCRQCVSKGRSKAAAAVPPPQAEDVPALLPTSNVVVPSSEAITKSSSLSNVSEADHHMRAGAGLESQQHGHYDDTFRTLQGGPYKEAAAPQNNDASKKHNSLNVRSVDISIAPKEPAAMRETPSTSLHRLPPTDNLMDSYRPGAPTPPMFSRGADSYRPSNRPRPPPVHMVKERETFLRHASKDERDHYLRQNRKAICKEITCPHQQAKDCRHGDKCMYSHDDTGHYFPSMTWPSKKWTCFLWLNGVDCPDREEECPFSHYDTGLYANSRGQASTKHVTCFWWVLKGECNRGANCLFAHHETGIFAEDPGRKHTAQRPNSPVRKTSDCWRPDTSTNMTARPPVSKSSSFIRDTPLSPVEPSYTESDEYEPPSVRATPQPEPSTESPSKSPNSPPRPVVEALPREAPKIPTTASDGRGPTQDIQLGTVDNSTPAIDSNKLMLNGTTTDEPPLATTATATAPKQYARRTGGVKLRKKRTVSGAEHLPINNNTIEPPGGDVLVAPTQTHVDIQPAKTSDPRKRKPAPSIVDGSHDVSSDKDERDQGEAQVIPAQPHAVHPPLQSKPHYVRCQACQKLIFASKAASHKCQSSQNGQQFPVDPKTSDSIGMTDYSLAAHPRDQGLSINTQVEQSKSPDVTMTPETMEQTLPKTQTYSKTPESTSHVPRRSESASDAENLFIRDKKRKRVSAIAILTHTSAGSPNAAQGHGPPFTKRVKPATRALSILELTELEALRKEFTWDEEAKSDDDAATLDDLRIMKKNKDDRQRRRALKEAEQMAREEAEEAAKKARRTAERKERLRQIEAEEARLEAEEARIIAEKEERLRNLKAALALSHVEPVTEVEERVSDQAAQARSKRADEDVDFANTSKGNIQLKSIADPAHHSTCDATVPTSVPVSHRQSSGEHPAEIQEVEERFNGIFSVINSDLSTSRTPANGAPSTPATQKSTDNQSTILQDQSLFSSTSSDEDGIEHDDMRIGNNAKFPRKEPLRRSCKSCRRRKIKCHHMDIPPHGVLDQQQASSPHASGPVLAPKHIDSARSSPPEADRLDPESKSKNVQRKGPHFRACSPCRLAKRKCDHGSLTAGVDSVPAAPVRVAPVQAAPVQAGRVPANPVPADPVEAEPPRKRQRVTTDSFRAESAPRVITPLQPGALEPMFSSIVAGISATKTATSAFAQAPLASTPHPGTTNTATALSKDDSIAEADSNLDDQLPLNTDPHLTYRDDTIPLTCGNCGALPPKRLRRFTLNDHLLCDSCYYRRSKYKVDCPLGDHGDSQDRAVAIEDAKLGDGWTFYLVRSYKCITALCTYCGWKTAHDSTKMTRHRVDCSLGLKSQKAINGEPPLTQNPPSVPSSQQIPVASERHQMIQEACVSPSVAAGLKAAKGLAYGAISKESAPVSKSIAPPEIQELFCKPLSGLVEMNEAVNGTIPETIIDYGDEYTGPRLVQSKMLDQEEKAAAVARMRAQGIEVISVDGSESDSDSSWSGSEICESSSYLFQPVPLVKSARYEKEPDPRQWVDEVEDEKANTFNSVPAQRRIKARPGLKANVKALENCKKPGKLLAISDWRSRVRKYGSFHRETERDPGPQKKGTFVREVADRTRLTIPRGFDDHEIMREEVEGTMHEFLGLPRLMKYDLMDSNRLVAARTLAFSDAAGRGRVPDRDKFPVRKGVP